MSKRPSQHAYRPDCSAVLVAMAPKPPLSLWRVLQPVAAAPSICRLAEDTAALHGLTLKDITGQDTSCRVSYVRQAIFALCREHGFSFLQIGRRLNRDHTTVLHGARAHQRRAAEGMAAE